MERKFWLERWSKNQIGFHQPQPNSWLVKYWPTVAAQQAVFVPLCGKSLDMRYLEDQGHQIVGIDLASLALEAYFEEADEQVNPQPHDGLTLYQGRQSSLYCGDLFELTAAELANVDAVFDRGALVAMPAANRRSYADHLLRILPVGARMLLIALEYDQHLVAGPPFSVLPEEVQALYGQRCEIAVLTSEGTEEVPPHFHEQGVHHATEAVYLVTKTQ